MGDHYYDKDGQPIDHVTWATRFEDKDYKRVAETTLPDGTLVSTVWLGIDHNFSSAGPPLIFETMAFPAREELREELEQRRYATLAEAYVGHIEIVGQLLKKLSPS